MSLGVYIFCMVCAFVLGALICAFLIWLFHFGIPSFKEKKWIKLEQDVVYIVKKNFDRPISITEEYIKDLIKEVENEQKKQ